MLDKNQLKAYLESQIFDLNEKMETASDSLALIEKTNIIQKIESRLKKKADHIIIPNACKNSFKGQFKENKITTYNGYKENFYIADYTPNNDFKKTIPFNRYIVIRPEAMSSFYVKETKSLVPTLLKKFKEKNIENINTPPILRTIKIKKSRKISTTP